MIKFTLNSLDGPKIYEQLAIRNPVCDLLWPEVACSAEEKRKRRGSQPKRGNVSGSGFDKTNAVFQQRRRVSRSA